MSIAALVFLSHVVCYIPYARYDRATFFAAMDPDGMHLGNAKTAKIFIKNFFTDFKATLGKKNKSLIKDFSKCDFGPIRDHLNEQKIVRKAITDDERKANKEDRNQAMYKYGFAIVDDHLEKVGNYNMVSKSNSIGWYWTLWHVKGISNHPLLFAPLGTSRCLSRTRRTSQDGKAQATCHS